MKDNKIENVIDELISQYTIDGSEHPWIIGFSGGKDSTVLLTLVWKALERVKQETPTQLRRPVYVVCNDTLVENPIITEYVNEVLMKIDKAARDQQLPIFVKKTIPKLEDTFWVNIIGKGYPVPNNAFRWCTERLKIRPTSNFLIGKVDERGEAIILIGARSDESATRSRSIKKHEIKGKRLTKHPNHSNTYVYSPIKNLTLEEIWYIIRSYQSPWGYDNSRLYQIYFNANAVDYECPTVVTDKSHPSCGQSRFGCWTCTVVKEDKSMSNLIRNGEIWMKPLLDFRNKLSNERNISENRSKRRRNGKLAVNDEGINQGNYAPEYRARILRELLLAQKEIQVTKPLIELISNQELIAIQVYWYRDGIFNFNVRDIFTAIYGKELPTDGSINDRNENLLLKDVCKNYSKDYELISNLLTLQHSKTLLLTNYGLQNDIELRIESFIRHNTDEV